MDTNIFQDLWENITQFSALASLICSLGAILVAVFPLKKWIDNCKKNKGQKKARLAKINEVLAPIKGSGDIINDLITTKFYIPINVQKDEPNIDNEYEVPRFDAIDYFTDQWTDKHTGKRRCLIFGGSGTGKTTFLASLVYHYILVGKGPYTIKLLRLESSSVLADIEKIDNPENTILLLDALDENLEANRNAKEFVSKLTQITDQFLSVIITCRLQLFSNEGDLPKKIKSLGLFGSLEWEWLYLSPFRMEDVREYLQNKYSCPSKEYSKAISIVEKSSSLMSRAMVLSFIDDLLGLGTNELTGFQLYKCIVDKWLTRELENTVSEDKLQGYIKNYYYFSSVIAERMYRNWIQENPLAISSEEFDELAGQYRVLFPENGYSYRVRSLVERDPNGNIRFAHKSFWEFFVALYSVENPGKSFSIEESGNAQNFANEIMDLFGVGIQYDVIDYYQPMPASDEISIKTILDNVELRYNDIDFSEQEAIYYDAMCTIYRYFCHKYDYAYYNYELAYREYNHILGYNLIIAFNCICQNILSSPEDISKIRKFVRDDIFRLPNYVLQSGRKQRVIYQLPLEVTEVQQLLTNQIWLSDSFSRNESALPDTINRLLRLVHNHRMDDAFSTLVPTIGVVKEIEKEKLSSFVLSTQNAIKDKLNDSGVVILFDFIVGGVHVPLAVSSVMHFNSENINVFIDRMMRSIERDSSLGIS